MHDDLRKPALLTPGEVANLFRVNTRTVKRWADEGKLPCIKTVGGHRRYRRADVMAVFDRREDGDS